MQPGPPIDENDDFVVPAWVTTQWAEEDAGRDFDQLALDEYGRPEPTLDEWFQRALTIPPGQWSLGLLEFLKDLNRPDHGGRILTANQRIELVDILRRLEAHQAAVKARLLVEIDRKDTTGCLDRRGKPIAGTGRDEVALMLRMSPTAARGLFVNATTLVQQLPATLAALDEGIIDPPHARALVDQVGGLDAAEVAAVEAAGLKFAGQQSLRQLQGRIRRALAKLATAPERHHRARQERRVEKIAHPDGMGELRVILPAEQAVTVYQRLDAAARLLPPCDERTRDQQRADLFVDAILAGIPANGLPTKQGLAIHTQLIIGLSTALHLDNNPGHLDGYGAIDADTARRLAHDPTGTWRRVLIDPVSNRVLDYGTTLYQPPKALKEHVVFQDPTCVSPYGTTPARHADLDHTIPWRHDGTGGPTSAENLAPLARRPHNLKTHLGWRYKRYPDNTIKWTLPNGKQYMHHPEERWEPPLPLIIYNRPTEPALKHPQPSRPPQKADVTTRRPSDLECLVVEGRSVDSLTS